MKNLYINLLLFLPIFFFAQVPVIETGNGRGKYDKNSEVILYKLNIETKIIGRISTNTVTMVFKNNSNRLKEGRVTFPLPEGVTANGYALDINGKLRHAVPVEKEKAREVYETIKKKNVDPGILEKVGGNNFRTTIYPIAANGGERTVQITYSDELKKSDGTYQYFLPLNGQSEIPEFTLKATVFQTVDVPKLQERPDGNFNFIKNGNIWTAEICKTKYRPQKNVKISIPQNYSGQSILMQGDSGNSSYFLAGMTVKPNERAKKLPGKLAVIWDNSLSGKQRDHIKEWALLEEYFKSNKNLTVQTYLISNSFEKGKLFKIENGNWDHLKNYLSGTVYDGGTDFGQLKPVGEDEIIFFTDGISSFGELKLPWIKPTYTVCSSNNTHFNQLKYISNITGGEFLNLNENEPAKEVRKLLFQPLKFLGIEENRSLSEVYPSLSQTVAQDFMLTGILKGNKATVNVRFGYGNEVSSIKTLFLNSDEQSVKEWEISRFWAQKKLNELEIFEKKNKEEIKNLSRRFGLVSSNMSLLVLENVEDYVQYDIPPPAELQSQFNAMVENNKARKSERVKDLMHNAVKMTKTLKEWWNKEYREKERRYPKPSENTTGDYYDTIGGVRRNMRIEEVAVTGIRNAETADEVHDETVEIVKYENSAVAVSEKSIQEIVVRGYGNQSRQSASLSNMRDTAAQNRMAVNSLQGQVQGIVVGSGTFTDSVKTQDIAQLMNGGKVRVINIESRAGYMMLFKNAKKPEAIYQIYLKNRDAYENLPQYYFDVSQLLFDNNDKNLGLKVLSAIADLDFENEELYKLLAYKLKQAEIYDKELFATQKVMDWRPFDPQSYRDYALALEDNGQFQKALAHLYSILTQSYAKELADRDDGIEEIVIMEINRLISIYGDRLDLKGINPEIIADLPVNIRVVLNWNKDDTDIDLWVTDPDNERCMYSHNQTAIGGRLSNDFTDGFGPEQFLLKKAVKGKYKIETDFFSERQVGIAGPTAMMAEIYINYATGKQERKIVVFQQQKENREKNKGILIGEFEF